MHFDKTNFKSTRF